MKFYNAMFHCYMYVVAGVIESRLLPIITIILSVESGKISNSQQSSTVARLNLYSAGKHLSISVYLSQTKILKLNHQKGHSPQ